MTLRDLVFARTSGEPTLNVLDLDVDTVYANGGLDSPRERFWAILRWGPELPALAGQRGAGRMTERNVALWVYDKEKDYGRINAAIRRWRELMDALESVRTGLLPTDGWVIEAGWNGDGDDGYDDVWEACFRSSEYTIIASGE